MDLEKETINACEYYNNQRRALIHKAPTPIHPVKVNYQTGKITLAFFESKSTVDFTGNYKGRHIAFDTKETKVDTRFDLSLVKKHQYEYLRDNFIDGGISFLIVSFTTLGDIYLLPIELLDEYWRSLNGKNRKSIPINEFEYEIENDGLIRIGFLKSVDQYLKGGNNESSL